MNVSYSKISCIALACLVLFLSSCATTVHTPNLDSLGSIPDDIGVVVVTHGRKDIGFFKNISFVSYEVAHINSDSKLIKDEFLPAEDVRLSKPYGDMGEGKYGFMHMFELPEGKYYLIGKQGRGYDSMIPAGGFYIYDYSSNADTNILMETNIVGGKINYLGEILIESEPLSNENIVITDFWKRDKITAERMNPKIKGLPYIHVKPRKIKSFNRNY